MMRSLFTRRSLMILGAALWLAGCKTVPWSQSPGGGSMFDLSFDKHQRPKPAEPKPKETASTKNTEVAEEGPPEPAPALFIPGPPRPIVQTASHVAQEEPETLPLVMQAQQTQDGAPNIASAGGPTPLSQAAASQNVAPQIQGPAPKGPPSPLRELYEKAARKNHGMDSYTVRMKRREVVSGQNRPEELMMFSFRKEPWSVYFKWLGPEAKGREVVYVRGRHENMIHTLLAAGDVLLMPAGGRFKVAPDSFLVRSKSRYPITEAGFGSIIDRFGRFVNAVEKGDPREGTGKYLGMLQRPEFQHQMIGVLQSIPPRTDPLLPGGGQRLWCFDPTLDLPMLVITQDDGGREVEYYCYDRLQFPVRLDDADFNPDILWKKK